LRSTLLASLALAGAIAASAVAANASGPTIVAKPTSAMVNTKVKLHGKGFDPETTLTLKECSVTSWSLPLDPCVTGNEVTVTTNARGGFHAKMTVGICPPNGTPVTAPTPSTVPVGTQRTCYIGAVHPSGIDTIELVGAVAIQVSWP
jgi:hypothetical protein